MSITQDKTRVIKKVFKKMEWKIQQVIRMINIIVY